MAASRALQAGPFCQPNTRKRWQLQNLAPQDVHISEHANREFGGSRFLRHVNHHFCSRIVRLSRSNSNCSMTIRPRDGTCTHHSPDLYAGKRHIPITPFCRLNFQAADYRGVRDSSSLAIRSYLIRFTMIVSSSSSTFMRHPPRVW